MGNQTRRNQQIIMTGEKPDISPMPRPAAPQLSLPREWPYRLLGNTLIMGIIFFLASVAITIKTDLINKKLLSLQDSFYILTSNLGFTIDDIIVTGRKRTSVQSILNTLGLSRRSNILNINLHELQDRIETLPWVKSARIQRTFFPNVINIYISEHQVKSLWQYNEKFHPIDEDGHVIDASYTPTSPILLIVGSKAPENINQLLEIIKTDSEIFSRVKVANFISERRWDLILDDIEHGITIKLPEDNIAAAWKKLIKLNASKNILKRKLTNIDLRLPGKVIVKLEKTNRKDAKKLKNIKESKI